MGMSNGRRRGRHVGGNRPWRDAACRWGRAVRPTVVRIGGAVATGVVEAVTAGLLR